MVASFLVVAAITAVMLLLVLVGMAVGVLFGRKPISGSCGGIANQRDEQGNVSCGLCSNPAEGCKELQEKMKGPRSAN